MATFRTAEARVWDLCLVETPSRDGYRMVICATPGHMFQTIFSGTGADSCHVYSEEGARIVARQHRDGAAGIIAEADADCGAGHWAKVCLDSLIEALDYAFPGCAATSDGGAS